MTDPNTTDEFSDDDVPLIELGKKFKSSSVCEIISSANSAEENTYLGNLPFNTSFQTDLSDLAVIIEQAYELTSQDLILNISDITNNDFFTDIPVCASTPSHFST